MTHMEWPHLYRVYINDVAAVNRAEFTVLSRLGEHKAVAMAIVAHAELTDSWPVYDVAVEDLGLAPREPDGTVGSGPPGTLEDRAEF